MVSAAMQTDRRFTLSEWGKWLPLAILPAGTIWLAMPWPPWQFMWALALSLYISFKWLSLADYVQRQALPPTERMLSFLLLWPGMDADAFFGASGNARDQAGIRWLFALVKIAFGLVIFFAVAPRFLETHPLIAGWIAMIGIAFFLHFGLLHLLALVWRAAGVNVTPIMQAPILADSVTDFWSRRWNLAFRDLVHRFVFRPLARKRGLPNATMAVFVVSGLIHDFVISLSARGGYGLPSLYFLLQGGAMLLERSRVGMKLGIRSGLAGRIMAALVVVLPLGLLFPPAFVLRVVVPMLRVITDV